MFTKQSIIKHTKILLALLIFHFIITTFIRFQLWVDFWLEFLNTAIVNLWKEVYLAFIYFLIIGYAVKNKKVFKANTILIFFIILFVVSILISLLNWFNIKALILGIKYDFWILLPVVMYQLIDFDENDKKNFYNFFLKLIKITIVLSLFFEIIRFVSPKILYLIWYWPLGDWIPWQKPPMYFETWFYWIRRFSWIFSGPNHMAFYFVAFWPLILLSIFYRRLHFIWWILYLILLIWTLSRSGAIAFVWQIILIALFIFIYNKNLRRKILFIVDFLALMAWIWWVYLYLTWKYHQIILRGSSTKWHITKSLESLEKIKENLFIWHWLWTAWPATHYTKTDVIPESWFLQIFYELWFVWWLLWFAFLLLVVRNLYLTWNKKFMKNIDIMKVSLSIWVIWLLIQGLVLHSFEDSMISLPLFMLIWIFLSWLDNKN